MKSKKIIGILIFTCVISIIFIAGYIYEREKYSKIETNGIRWSMNSNNVETNIKLSEEKIAPGSSGNFTIEVDANKSETDIFYKVKVIEENNIPKNIKLYAEMEDELGNILLKTKEYNSFSNLAEENLFGTILVGKQNQKRFIKLYWNWEFENENTQEFDDLIISNEENSLDCYYNIEIIGEQIKANN